MVEVVFVTTNPGKVREVRSALAPYGVQVRWLRRRLVEPQADSLEEVARAKLASLGPQPGYVLVEDSGLFVPSLAGFPGVYSAHFLKAWGFGPMLELLRRRNRSAAYKAVAVLGRGRNRWVFRGEVQGSIARRPSGHHGFGYDPLFVPRGYRASFGVLPDEVKRRLSHRAQAMQRLGEFLERRERRRARQPTKRKRG